MEYYIIKMDIIKYYLLPNSTALQLYNQKYRYAEAQKISTFHIYIYLCNFIFGSSALRRVESPFLGYYS